MARRPRAPGASEQRLIGDGLEGVLGELELDLFHLEELLVLLGERVLRLDQDADQGFLGELGHRADDRQPADELGDEAELEQILGADLGVDVVDGPGLSLRASAVNPIDFGCRADLR